MKTRVCISLENLQNLDESFKIQEIETEIGSEDYKCKKLYKYVVCRYDIEKVSEYHSLWSSKHIYLNNGTKISLYPNNVNSDNVTLERILNNKNISPALKISDDYVEITNELKTWLINYGIPEYKIESYSRKFVVSHIVEYTGIGDVEKSRGGCWCYSSSDKPMRLTEEEINIVLNGIENELLKKKIEHLLYARIFKLIDFN